MERELFSWLNWNGDHEIMSFHPVTLNVPIGRFKKGDVIACATIMWQGMRNEQGFTRNGVLQLQNEKGEVLYECELHLRLGAAITK